MKKILLFSAILSISIHTFSNLDLLSPDGKIDLKLNTDGELTYTVSFNGKLLISSSRLGFEFADQAPLSKDLRVQHSKVDDVSSSWEPVWGKHKVVDDHYNALFVDLKEQGSAGRVLKLECRAYNDGISFRYFLQPDGNSKLSVMKELTEFNFTADHFAWMADYGGYKSHQESEFLFRKINDLDKGTRIGTPLLVKAGPRSFLAILEANIDNWPGMYLAKNDFPSGLKVMLSPPRDGTETDVKAVLAESQYSPWRVVMIADNPGKFIESEIVANLNEPSEIADPSWIKPGLCAWDHWWSGEVQMDTKTIKQYIRLASNMGWPYMLIDWQWYGPFDQPGSDITTVNPDVDMDEVLAYAKKMNVRCWLWLYWTDADRQYEEAFPLYEKWGIAGVKIDFMQLDDQEMVNWYEKIIKKAAQHHLMVNFHGAYKPDGIRRTWPNMMTREGVLGNEYNKWSTRVTPEHNTTLPFTRMLAGPMDYTPGGFLNRTPETFRTGVPANVMTTRSQQLAMFVVYESPVITVCDHPDHYYDREGIDFLRDIPATWDDTKFIAGYPGDYIAVARKSGNKWYVGILNNSHEKQLEIKLDFLGKGRYDAIIYSDTDQTSVLPETIDITEGKYRSSDIIRITLARGGGFAAVFQGR